MSEKNYISSWPMIPSNAFLYFPTGEDVRSGSEEKQWRKIFEGGQIYEAFEQQNLQKLQQKLLTSKEPIDDWFSRQNKLRYLQANKFKVSKTIESMVEYSRWRKQNFPVALKPEIEKLLGSGGFYFCGRDNQYRPIIVADISKFSENDVQNVQFALVIIMEYMINNLLIEGQVENYVLILNLEAFSWSLKSVVMKIISFTSNSYRGRLYVSYLLSMPGILRFGWNSVVSNFVSQNTLKKLKVSGDNLNNDMWDHISKNTIEQKYGGSLKNLSSQFWPPRKQLMLFENQIIKNNLITQAQYRHFYNAGKLITRKIKQQFIQQPLSQNKVNSQRNQIKSDIKSQIKQQQSQKSSRNLKVLIRGEVSFIKEIKPIKTFFQEDSFLRICGQLPKADRGGCL